MNLIALLDELSEFSKTLLALLLVAAVGLGDLVTGYEVSFSLFYILPIALTTWITDRRFGLLVSVMCAGCWLSADLISGHQYSNALIPIWNTLIRLGMFMVIAWLMADLRAALDREKEMARIDNLTGAVNHRQLLELVRGELERQKRYRHPFTLAYLDLDNFKQVNDQFGHAAGDQVLRVVVEYAKARLRTMDVVARLGGDEFAVLLPETNSEAARSAINSLQTGLVNELGQHRWQVTVSTGAVTCTEDTPTIDELFRTADSLMYEVKRAGKNSIRYATFAR